MNKISQKFVVAMTAAAAFAFGGQVSADEKVTFDDQIKPLFAQRCAACHNPNKKSGDLDVTNYTALMQGGGSGTVIEVGDAMSSYLYALVTHEDSPEMPPDSDKIPDPEIQLLQKWIDGGALENKDSKAILPKKKKVAVVDFDASQRPEKVPTPCRLSLEADVVPHRQPIVTAMATSPWAPIIAVGGAQQVSLYDSQSLKLKGVLAFPEGQINVLKFSRNGSLLLAAGGRGAANGVAIAWNIETGERVIEITGEMDAVLAADLNKDHSLLAVGGSSRLVRVFSTDTGKLKFELKKHTDWVQAIEFSPDGVLLASGDRSGGVLVWEAMTGREYLDLRGHQGPITDVTWRIDSNILATASQDTTIKLWEMENGGQIKSWGAHGGGVSDIEFTRDSRIASCGRDNHAKIFDQNGGQQKAYPVQQNAISVTHCDETNRLVTCNFGAEVSVHNIADDQKLTSLVPNPAPLAQRLGNAETEFASVKQQFDAATAAANNVKTQLDAKTTELNTASTEVAQLTEKLTQLSNQIEQMKTDLASQQSQMATATDVVNRLTPGLANVGQAIEAIDRAQNTMKSEQLQASRSQLAQLKQEHETQLASNTQLMQTLKPQIESLQTKMTEMSSQQTEMKSMMEQKAALVETLKPVIDAMTKDHADKAAAVAGLQPTFQQTQQQVQRYLAAIEFEKSEAEILSRMNSEWSALESQADSIAAAQQELQSKQQTLQAEQGKVDQKNKTIETWMAEIATLQQQKEQWNVMSTNLQKQMQEMNGRKDNLANTDEKLQLSLTALNEALEMDANDEALKASKEKMAALIAQRKQQVETLMQQINETNQQIASLSQQMKAAEAKMGETQMAIDATKQEVAQLTEAIKPLIAARDTAQANLDAAHSRLQELTGTYDSTRNELLSLRESPAAESSDSMPVSAN